MTGKVRQLLLVLFLVISSTRLSSAQMTIPFTSGPIPLCDTVTFTANVVGVGLLRPPAFQVGAYTLYQLGINITSNHPHTLKISLTSPQGTTIVLSAFNGAGGSNYTSSVFTYSGSPSITTGTAPFTGYWQPQTGSFSDFDFENADGTWTITIIDTACANGGIGPGGTWTPGWFNGGGTGGFFIDFSIQPPPPCLGWINSYSLSVCQGVPVDIEGPYLSSNPSYQFYFNLNGNAVSNPSAVTVPGTYNVEAYDPWTGCWYFATFDVIHILPNFLGPDQTVNATCTTSSVNLATLFNLAGFTSTWTLNGTPVSNPTAVSISGTYQLIAQDAASGCSDTALVNLSISPAVNMGSDLNLNTCNGTSIDLTNYFATTGLTTSWYYNGAPFASPAAASAAGLYTLVATNVSGCSDTVQVTLAVLPGPALGADQIINACQTGSFDLTTLYSTTGMISNWTYNGNPVPNPAAVNASGNYMLVVTDPSNCSDTALVTLNLSPNPSLGPDQSVSICSGLSFDLTTLYNTSGMSATWYAGGNPFNTPASATMPGVYSLVVTTGAGCSDTAEVNLNVQASPSLGPDGSQSICSNSSANLSTLYNTAGYTTSWTYGGAAVADPSAVNAAGTYTLVAINAAGCSDTAAVLLSLLNAPALGPDQNVNVCTGNTTDLTALFSTGTYSTAWSYAGLPFLTPATAANAGVYTLIASDGGCNDTALVNLTVQPNPVLGPGQQLSICSGGNADLTALYNTASYTVSWTFNGNPVANPMSVGLAGVYLLTVSNAAGCTATANVSLNVDPVPVLGADQNHSLCDGSALDLNSLFALSGLNASWTLAGVPVSNPQAVSSAGTYQLVAINSYGCSDTAQVSISVGTGPSLGPDLSFALCPWQSVDLSTLYAVGAYSTVYTFNGNVITAFTAVYDSGTYSIVVTDTNGCSDEALVLISHVQCLCTADFDFSARCLQDPVTFMLEADSAILGAHWNFSSAGAGDVNEINPAVKFEAAGNHLVTVKAQLTCGTVEVQKYVRVVDCADSCHFYVPSAFSPNSDGKNDTFSWYSECVPELFNAEIYNRFGQMIFQTKDPRTAWDGKSEDHSAPSGIYVYHIEYKLPYQDKQSLNGRLTVVW
ncbi:MAG: gliding motility-associated C-terminal domain-containing protein [Bacteroidia bacterium]|nr:gliding motility-associated C-terminal domain-containing protein [Bacteroidia bacterium]